MRLGILVLALAAPIACVAGSETARETVPSNLCYGVRYGVDPKTGQGYIQTPPHTAVGATSALTPKPK